MLTFIGNVWTNDIILIISKVTLVFKTSAVTYPGNYRSIAVLPPFAKILERLVNNQLSDFLEKENILFKHQFGFRKNYSTEQAILELTDDLKMKIDNNEAICSIFHVFTSSSMLSLIIKTSYSLMRSFGGFSVVRFWELKAELKHILRQ